MKKDDPTKRLEAHNNSILADIDNANALMKKIQIKIGNGSGAETVWEIINYLNDLTIICEAKNK
jgi:hypothetical protein